MRLSCRTLVAVAAGLSLVGAACGDDSAGVGDAGPDRPSIVVTTNILGDVVENLVGDGVEVSTIMPVGADPHSFQASAQQVAAIGEAEVLIVNGAGFEEGLLDVIEAAEGDGVPVFEAISAVTTIDGREADHDDELDDDDHHDHDGADPHFFTDPARMALAAEAIADHLIAALDGIDPDALAARAEAYVAELEALDAEIVESLGAVADEHRVLVTNHEVFGYFADRYDFEVIGAVIPRGSTVDGVSAQELADLVALVEREGVPAIFADTSASDDLARTLADEVGAVEVVELYSESLGPEDSDGATYLAMMRANARRIAAALAG